MFNSKKKLIVSGCSYTDDRYEFPVWPTVLGKKLDMEVINLAESGCGNEYIYSTLLDRVIEEKNVGLVVVMWSEFNRIDFETPHPSNNKTKIKTDGWRSIHTIRNNFYTFDGYPVSKQNYWKDEISNLFNKYKYSEPKYRTRKSLRRFYSLQKILESLDIKYLQIVGTKPDWGADAHHCSKEILASEYTNLIDEKTFIGWPIFKKIGGFTVDHYLDEIDPTCLSNRIDGRRMIPQFNRGPRYDSHPNKLGHEQMADLLYNQYVENTHEEKNTR